MNKVGIYLHFPYCRKKCLYCDFYSSANPAGMRSYELALARHLAAFRETLSPFLVDTVYFGGGTPSLCSPQGLAEIFRSLKENFSVAPDSEITCEMNPESATEKILSTAARCGVNRISLGMQSALPEELSTIGRIHTFEDVARAVKEAKKAGISRISLDLMYGLPGQTVDSFLYSVSRALDLGVEHLSFYMLTLSPKAPLYQTWKETEEEILCQMYLSAVSLLEKHGFSLYEISNAALPGCESRHNLRYWRREAYLGVGPGAHSFLNQTRFSMKEDTDLFISASNPFDTIENREKVSDEDQRTEYLMLSLRTATGVDWKKLLFLSSGEFCSFVEKKVERYLSLGLATRTDSGFALTPKGFLVSNEIISELI